MPYKWTRFQPATSLKDHNGMDVKLSDREVVWVNSRYTVHLTMMPEGLVWLSIKSRDRTARHDWRDFQRIKNELCGPECEGMEIYPAESRLHDSADQFHLWVMPKGVPIPYGFANRDVSEFPPPGVGSQRKFESKPYDLLSREEEAKKSPLVEWFMPYENKKEVENDGTSEEESAPVHGGYKDGASK